MKRRNVLRAGAGGIVALVGGTTLLLRTDTVLATSHSWEIDDNTTIETADGDVDGIVIDDDTDIWPAGTTLGTVLNSVSSSLLESATERVRNSMTPRIFQTTKFTRGSCITQRNTLTTKQSISA